MYNILKNHIRFIPTFGLFIVIIFSVSLFTSCKKEIGEVIEANHYDSLQLAPFVEPDFPFITTNLNVRDLGHQFPEENYVARGLVVQLGNESYMCFDTDLLRWSVAWTGDFIALTGMPQISYNDFFNKKNGIPTVLGKPQIATGIYAGWSTQAFDTTNPRRPSDHPEGYPWGPIPPEKAQWKGVYLNGSKVLLSYEVGQAQISEEPGQFSFGQQSGFLRRFSLKNQTSDLYLNLAEVANGKRFEQKDHYGILYSGANEDTVTIVAVLDGKEHVSFNHKDHTIIGAKVEAGADETDFTLALWSGVVEDWAAFEAAIPTIEHTKTRFDKGGPAYWTESVYTKAEISPDTAAYVTDIIALPVPNPWQRNMRAADIDFFDNGDAAVVTYSGDVWIAKDMTGDLDQIEWTRYASGLYEPMSVEIVDEDIYVFGKEGILILHDLNKDGVADYYENFCNLMEQSMESREWAADLVLHPNGDFYIAKGGALNAGPKFSPVSTKGFRVSSNQDGTIQRISADGKTVTQVATGFRGPYLGMNPKTGYLTASDQQGNYVPSTPIMLVNEGDYYGVPSTAHRPDTPTVTKPLMWIPHNVEPSGLGQVWVTSDKMGPLKDQLIHMSFGRPGLFHVLLDSTSNDVQGGISYLPAHYPAPTSKGVIHPKDGQLYVAGFNLWGSKSRVVSAMLRLRYTGKEYYLPRGFQVGQQGIILEFGHTLDQSMAENAGNYIVKRWNYDRTEEYGSGHFKLDGHPGQDVIPVLSAHLSEDQQSVLLVIPQMKEVQQMEVNYRLTLDTAHIENQFWLSVNDLEPLDLASAGFGSVEIGDLDVDIAQMAAQQSTVEASVELGEALFQKMACAGCHSSGTVTKGMYGPPFQDLYGSMKTFTDGSTRKADADYLRESILTPDKEIVEGYDSEMPSFVGILSETDIESLILYIQSLSNLQ